MNEELDRLTHAAVQYREIGCSIAEIADLLVDRYPSFKVQPFNLAQVLRSAFGLSVQDLHYVVAWLQGELSLEELEEHLPTTE